MNKLLSVVSAIGMLAAVSAAQASEVITNEQMDMVTAGVARAFVSAAAVGGTVTNGTFTLAATNTTPTAGSAAANISASLTPTGPVTNIHSLTLSATATAP